MSNVTPIYWEADGLSLSTEAWMVRTFGGTRNSPPLRRGSNLQMPFRAGRIHVEKVVEQTIRSLEMTLLPVAADGGPVPAQSSEQTMHENWRLLMDVLAQDGQYPLKKRWWDGAEIAEATAMVEFAGGMEPEVSGARRLSFMVDLIMADPYFYVPKAPVAVGAMTVDGDAPTEHVVLTLTGGSSPKVTFPDGNWIQYVGSPGATPVVVNLLTGMAKQGTAYVNGKIKRNDYFARWPRLEPGDRTLTLTGGGSATVAYDAAFK